MTLAQKMFNLEIVGNSKQLISVFLEECRGRVDVNEELVSSRERRDRGKKGCFLRLDQQFEAKPILDLGIA